MPTIRVESCKGFRSGNFKPCLQILEYGKSDKLINTLAYYNFYDYTCKDVHLNGCINVCVNLYVVVFIKCGHSI